MLLVILVAGGGCGAAPPAVRPAAPGSAVTFSRPPVIDGRREACLAPPYAPAPGASALADGSPVSVLATGRGWRVSLGGERALSPDEGVALLGRLRDRDPALRFLGYGVYCGEPAHLCFQLAGSLCELRVEDAVRAVRDALALDVGLADARVELQVVLEGALGPRCSAGDPACVPLPYEGDPSFDPAGPRHTGRLAEHSAGACAHDGECVVGGCGNDCVLWEYGGANESATCEGYVFSDPAPMFCGCVEGGCAWFTQH